MSIARCRTVVGSLYALMRNALGINVATSLESQELSCTVAPDRRLVVLGHDPIAGFTRDHGTVANEAAMLALHTLDSTTLLAEPTFVAPGDSCIRADDPGWRWHCISGHGQSLSDWERRPLAGAIAAEVAGLDAALDGKQPLASALTTLSGVDLTDVGLALLGLDPPTGDPRVVQVSSDGTVQLVEAGDGGTGGGVLPAPNNGAGVLVSNGQAWYALSSPTPGSALVLNQAGVPVWATVEGITYDPNAGQPQITGGTLQCTYSAGGDGNGIFYALGTNLRRQAWANPVSSWPKIRALDSNNGTAGPTGAAGRTENSTSVTSTANTWCAFDLGQRRQMAVTDYTYRTGAGASYALRNWKLQGSNNVAAWNVTDINAATWVDIDTHADDTTISTTGYYRFACNGDTETRFRFLRLVMTGVNADNDWRLIFGNLEFYGQCTLFQFNIPAGTYSLDYSSDGDGNGLVYFLGSVGLTRPFENPVWAGDIAWIHDMPTVPAGDFPLLFNRLLAGQVTSGAWKSTTSGSFVLDFGANRTCSINRYSLYYSYDGIFPRNWKLQGIAALPGFTMLDVNAAVWTDIDVRVADTTINAGYVWGTFVPNGDTTTRFRYLRWLNTGANSEGGAEFRPSELEFYGTLKVTT